METKELKNSFDAFEFEVIAVEDLAQLTGGNRGNGGTVTDYGELIFPDIF
jgi:hypothetical protein